MRSGGAGAERFRGVWCGRAPHNSKRWLARARISVLSPSRILSTMVGGMDPEA
jgi:hypothetical protein